MTITWLGQNCFKIEGKSATVVVDPFEGSKGNRMPKVAADLLLLLRSYPEKERDFLKDNAFIIETPGEYEVKEVLVEGQASGANRETVFRMVVDGVHIGHLGNQKELDETAAELLEGVDILFVPVGGGEVLSSSEAAAVVNKIEPRIIIPMHFKEESAPKLEPVGTFAKELGQATVEHLKKFVVTKKDLPNDETKLVILDA
ncbi:MAG: MBL fold metallo-hydrolase [Patescibacteria group bacterium]|jgi:L-ascorbate metabolism protein UlaG (beta-lactamase superfamily)